MMYIEKLIERLKGKHFERDFDCTPFECGVFVLIDNAADALSTLQAENEKLRAELEQVERLYESEKEDFIDFACSGVLNLSPYCLNRNPDCVDERGWCRTEKCRGFSRERGQKED